MQTTPLDVSQLAGHLKLPLVKTVQDHTEELFRHRTTLPPLNSTSGTQLHLRVKELLVWALYLHHDSSLRGQRSPKRGGDWGCAGWGRNGGGHLAQPVPRAAPAPPAAQRGPGCISCAGATNSTLFWRQLWVQWDPPRSQSCSLQSVPSPSPRTVYKRLAQITLPTESISMLPTLQSRVTHCIERILLHSNCFGEVFAICSRHQKSFFIYIYIIIFLASMVSHPLSSLSLPMAF